MSRLRLILLFVGDTWLSLPLRCSARLCLYQRPCCPRPPATTLPLALLRPRWLELSWTRPLRLLSAVHYLLLRVISSSAQFLPTKILLMHVQDHRWHRRSRPRQQDPRNLLVWMVRRWHLVERVSISSLSHLVLRPLASPMELEWWLSFPIATDLDRSGQLRSTR